MFSKRLMKRLERLTEIYARMERRGLLKEADLLQEVLVHLVRLTQAIDAGEPVLMDLARKRAIDLLRRARREPEVVMLPDEDGDALSILPQPDMDLHIDFTRAMNALTPEERLLLPLMEFPLLEQSRLTCLSRHKLATLHRSIRDKLRNAGLCDYLQHGPGFGA